MSIRLDVFTSFLSSTTLSLGDLKSLIELVAIDSTHPNWASSWSFICCAEVIKKENKDLVRAYVKHLINENITEKRNPLLFAIARANVIENIKNDVKLSKEIKQILEKVSKTEMFVNYLWH